jgi:hypothetical protein
MCLHIADWLVRPSALDRKLSLDCSLVVLLVKRSAVEVDCHCPADSAFWTCLFAF